ncbi:hypothetical protein T09_14425 [Trichinella sp. T9]|nr:hypothetical protein T09_14425 [Trichinella sp. T9]
MTSRTCLHPVNHHLVQYTRFCFDICQIVHQRLVHLGTIRRTYPHDGNLPNVIEQRIDELGVDAWTGIVALVRIFVKAGHNVWRICIASYAYRADIHGNSMCGIAFSVSTRHLIRKRTIQLLAFDSLNKKAEDEILNKKEEKNSQSTQLALQYGNQ